jgi:hypothetical protein
VSEVQQPPLRTSEGSGLPIALAAIAILESLMVTLVERKLVDPDDLQEAMQAAIDSHLHAEPSALTKEDHRAAARVIQRFRQGANSVRASARL